MTKRSVRTAGQFPFVAIVELGSLQYEDANLGLSVFSNKAPAGLVERIRQAVAERGQSATS